MSITISGNGVITGATTSYSFDQSVSIGGTLTYEDVTNIDSVGVITARSGLDVGPLVGIAATIDASGNVISAGTVSVGNVSSSAANGTGARLRNLGDIVIRKDGSVDEVFAVFKDGSATGNKTVQIKNDGSAEFAGQLTVKLENNNTGKERAARFQSYRTESENTRLNIEIDNTAQPIVRFDAEGYQATNIGTVNNFLIGGTLTDNTANIELRKDGSATFAGSVTVGSTSTLYTNITVNRSDDGYIFQGGKDAGFTSRIFANGSATFAGNVISGSNASAGVNNPGVLLQSSTGAIFSYITDNSRSFLTGYFGTNIKAEITSQGNATFAGALSKGSGSFRIDHPLPTKTETHHLVHSFIEGPQADLIYRGVVDLVDGTATVNIDTAGRMTEGTFAALCTNVSCFTSNESDWTAVKGSVTGNVLTITTQDNTSTAKVSWMVVGERKDQHMIDTDWTDENGRVITEPLKS